MRRSQVFFYFCLCFLFGVALRSFVEVPLVWVFGFAVFGGAFGIVFFHDRKILWLSLGVIFLFFGVWRMDVSATREVTDATIEHYNGKEVSLEGRVVDVDTRSNKTKITFDQLQLNGNSVSGKLLVDVSRFEGFRYGDEVRLSCVIESPGVFDGFDYREYLSKTGIYSVCYRSLEIVKTRHEGGSGAASVWGFFQRGILGVRYHVKETFDTHVVYPSSTLLSAIVLGLRREIPSGVLTQFQRTGTSHIIAISGLHITIITTLLWLWLLGAGLPRRIAFWVATIGLILFLMLIGFRPSAIRAGIMGWLIILAQYVGRPRSSINVLLLAASVLLLINPKLLRLDLGFQLSFLAVLGIMYFGPYVQNILGKLKVPELGVFQLQSTLTMTFAAQAAVLPWVVFNFETLSFISVFANIFILPVLAFVMILGIFLGVSGFVWTPIAQFLGWVISFPLLYVLFVSDILSRPDYAAVTVEQFPLGAVFLIYALMILFLWYVQYRGRRRRREKLYIRKDDYLDATTINF